MSKWSPLRTAVERKIYDYGLSKNDVAKALGICTLTFTNRLDNPKLLTGFDIIKICKILKFKPEEVFNLIGQMV